VKRIAKSELQTKYGEWSEYHDKFIEKYPEFDKYRMLEDLLTGESVLWLDKKGFVIGRPNYYHNATMFLIEAAGGEDCEEWVDGLDTIEEEVRAWGFTTVEFYGRLGWRKRIHNKGYTPAKIVMRKEI